MAHSHPEEVRKARDAGEKPIELRSPLLNGFDDRETGTSSPATRAESPLSTVENADWSYAFREAVVARLPGTNVDLDKLKDDDLNKLYADILKVRHSRSATGTSIASGDRPESRMSFLESVTEDEPDSDDEDSPSHRHFSGSTWSTGPTSVGESTITLSSAPEVEERLLAVKEDYEERIKVMIESAAEVNDVKAEKKQMEVKLQTLENQLRVQRKRFQSRVKKLRTNGDAEDDDELFDLIPLAPEEERRARLVIAKWRTRQRVRMAEDALSQAVMVKEANVISQELQKGVSFQFVVVERDVPLSGMESITGLTDIDEASDPDLSLAKKPCIGVKVLDRKNKAIYVWSLSKLRQRLQQMRNLYRFIGTEYSRHFSWEDPFYESPPARGGYSSIGSALVSLAPLSRNLPSTSSLQIYSPYMADPIGECRVRLKPLSIVNPENPETSWGNCSHPAISPFVEGSKLSFEITVEHVSGMTKSEFTSVHLQIHLASIFGTSFGVDDVVTSPPLDLTTSSPTELKLHRTLSVTVTSEIQNFLNTGYAPIEFFACVGPAHIDRIERWDEARDSASLSRVANTPGLRGDPTPEVTRRPETELVKEQQHDVLASVEIRELGESGEYVPVPVSALNSLDSGSFFLHQGLQRRLVLKIAHNSGRGWAWKKISGVTLGNVRMLDARGRMHAATPAPDTELRGIGKPRPTFAADGTAGLSFTSPWDSSVHDSPFLNRPTAANHRVLLRLKWEVESDVCASGIGFSMDIAVTVQGRDARPPSKLMSMFSSARTSRRVSNLFAVRLRPSMTKRPTDIWRLNTAETYVRGEEVLGSWKPRGLSLIRDHDQRVATVKKAADVQAARAVLEAFELTLPGPSEGVGRTERIAHAIELWQKYFGTKAEAGLSYLILFDVG